ncbi:hypothetical protein M0813_26649 [Anaeramoeba flamelloides]|uniref:Tyrosine-protein kinase ephrin type A/B receptor-like domain-containing protein n=1 Tax=Anaeramoeba flamelloides TaxID=1746091 RepID=A0ABQ8XZB9_9EUKA|nr:hypothetical protein M0813_26649 [Anaeramoeba flamelloides]
MLFLICPSSQFSTYKCVEGYKVDKEFQVNNPPDQTDPKIAFLLNSEKFIVIWGYYPSNAPFHLRGQFYNTSTMERIGNVFVVTKTMDRRAYGPDAAEVASISNGEKFLFTYNNKDYNVILKIYDSFTGLEIGNEIIVNDLAMTGQRFSRAISLSKDKFVVSWLSTLEVESYKIYAQIFNSSDISKIGNQFEIENGFSSRFKCSHLTPISNGHSFVIIWQTFSRSGNSDRLFAQIVNVDDGVKVGNEFQIDSRRDNEVLKFSHISSSGLNDEFAIIWAVVVKSTSELRLYLQIFKGNKPKFENDILVFFNAIDYPFYPKVAYISKDKILIIIDNHIPTNMVKGVYGIIYNSSDGSLLGDFFQVNTRKIVEGTQDKIDITQFHKNEKFVIVYENHMGTKFIDGQKFLVREGNCFCRSGTFEVDSRGCFYCPPGTYQDEVGQLECKKCPDGTYNDQEDMSSLNKCKSCPDSKIAAEEGSESCSYCPLGTEPNDSKDECKKCRIGYYKNDKNSICKPCDKDTMSIKRGATECAKCSDDNICLGGSECSEGRYDIRMCSICYRGYSKKGNSCKKCPSNSNLYLWIPFFIIILLLLFRKIKKGFNQIKILVQGASLIVVINSIQIFAAIILMNLNWPKSMSNSFVFAITGFFNLNFEMMFSLQCFESFNFYIRWLILVLIPILLMVILLVKILFFGIFAFTTNWIQQEKFQRICDSSIYHGALFWKYLYIPINLVCLEPFDITYQSEFDEYTLDSDPIISTKDRYYKKFLIWFIIFLILYVLVIPLIIILFIILAQRKHFPYKWKRKIGCLWDNYRSNTFYWEIVEIAIKLLIMLSTLMFTAKRKTRHSAFLFVILSFHIILVAFFKPRIQRNKTEEEIENENDNADETKIVSNADKMLISFNFLIIGFISLTFKKVSTLFFLLFCSIGLVGLLPILKERFQRLWTRLKNKKFRKHKPNKITVDYFSQDPDSLENLNKSNSSFSNHFVEKIDQSQTSDFSSFAEDDQI